MLTSNWVHATAGVPRIGTHLFDVLFLPSVSEEVAIHVFEYS